jgi:uncharacterized protein
MGDPIIINLRHLARGSGIPLRQIEAVLELLDEGNTVPFITRYRKDRTGGLDEEQIRVIQTRLTKMRLLAERKQTILRSIEAQGKLTEQLAKQIQGASTTKRLEDLYLPYKPKKQTLATLARSRGLEPLAVEILTADPMAVDLDRRAADFANPDRQVPSGADALLGAGHILAEQFSESAELRQKLREILQRTGKLISSAIGAEIKPSAEAKPVGESKLPAEPSAETQPALESPAAAPAEAPGAAPTTVQTPEPVQPVSEPIAETLPVEQAIAPLVEVTEPAEPIAEPVPPPETSEAAPPESDTAAVAAQDPAVIAPATQEPTAPTEPGAEAEPSMAPAAESTSPQPAEAAATPAADAAPSRPPRQKQAKSQQKLTKKELKKKRAEEKRQKAFSDYFSYSEEIRKIPPHRVLAINRGERARVIRVKVECEIEAMHQAVEEICVPAGHPHADFLRGCARDALTRLILPSLERDVRRELTERAETHAVEVFAKNLRKLLLQPPVHNRRILAVDPGFKSGCKLAALDEFGNLLGHGVIYLIGSAERRQEAMTTVRNLIDQYQLSVAAIGNGTACREVEEFFAELVGTTDLKDRVCYVIVNEAGASVYSTSRIGREELPNYDASMRGAISIGRRLQDPLSELVKIDPANIGVGLYQHDVKAKHLRTSLDDVVESCVNYVGVDVNTASPALLRYLSGLNQLTARRVYEHRLQHGPFRSREQLKEVPGFGEATFVQAAGFLKIVGGDNPLDATWIHPESYPIALRVLEKLGSTTADLTANDLAEKIGKLEVPALASEFQVGELLLKDILAQFARPGRDPREDLPAPVFKRGIIKLEDLSAGMELTGTVLNVVDFGAFVDIGMHDSGLVHVSQLADKFVRDPHEVVAVGDVVKVWVVEIDKQRRRVSLTMIPPGTPRTGGRREGRPQQQQQASQSQPSGRPPQARPPRPRTDRPPRPQRKPPEQGAPERTQRPPKPAYKPKRPPKPVTPLTDEMKTGKAPLRSFSDLAQFFEARQEATPKKDDRPNPPDSSE